MHRTGTAPTASHLRAAADLQRGQPAGPGGRGRGSPYLYLGVPTIAELSTLHGMVPPHPGPLIAVAGLHADLGTTIVVGLVCAVPRIVAGRPGIRRPDATVLRAASTGRR